MENLPLYSLIILLVVFVFLMSAKEHFSSSGMTISDDYCNKIADIYLDPMNKDFAFRNDYKNRLCGNIRRHMVDHKLGNYYTVNGILI